MQTVLQKDLYAIVDPTLLKVIGLILLVGVLWGALPYAEKFTLLHNHLSTEYFQFWRGLMVAVLVITYVLIKYRNQLKELHKPMTGTAFGLIAMCAVPTAVAIIAWLYLLRTSSLRVSITFSIITGIMILTTTLLGYAWTKVSKVKSPALYRMGETLQTHNYVGIGVMIVGIILVGLDLKRLPTKGQIKPEA